MSLKAKKNQSGFTIIELLIVIAVIAILALITINQYQGVQAKARDTKRVTDISNIKDKLEEYYNENSGYPSQVSVSNLPGMDAETIKDPKGVEIANNSAVASEAAALAVANPTVSGAQYKYIPFDDDSSCTNDCKGYVLKSFIERPTDTVTNPLIKKGGNNPKVN